MHAILSLVVFASPLLAVPVQPKDRSAISYLNDPNYGPIPGQTPLYNDYRGKSPPFPLDLTGPVPPTSNGPPGVDDELFQNLLSTEWIVFNFYQRAVEIFNQSSFTALGFPNTTYDRVAEIRDNEAGHFRIFQDSISSASVKPGSCKYRYNYTDVPTFLATQNLIEASSATFLTGAVEQAKAKTSQGRLVAISAAETRHAVGVSLRPL